MEKTKTRRFVMSFIKSFIVLALLVAVAAIALVAPPILYGQGRLPFTRFEGPVRAFGIDLDPARPQLGVTVEELPSQLAAYFGATGGVLVSGVTDASPAALAGLKAGDVIASLNGDRIRSRLDLVRAVGDASSRSQGDVSIGIVRDRKERSLEVRLEPANKRL